jgi:hypothetical protein
MNSKKAKQDKCAICYPQLITNLGTCKKCGHLNYFGSEEKRAINLGSFIKLLIFTTFIIVLYLNQNIGPFDIELPW